MKKHTCRSSINAVAAIALLFSLGACASAQGDIQAPSAALSAPLAESCCEIVTPAGHRIENVLDSSDVEHLWPKDQPIEWSTGRAIGPVGSEIHEPDTHCSAFTAAMAQRLGIYLPHPPAYSPLRLSEAQLAYMASGAGRRDGWTKVATPEQAQSLANQGQLVLVGYKGNHDKYAHQAGHIAVVRPSVRSVMQIRDSGVQMTQAGESNRRITTAKFGFRHHEGVWPDHLQYFAHQITIHEMLADPGL